MANQELVMTMLAGSDVPVHWGERTTVDLGAGSVLDPDHLGSQRVVSHAVAPLDDGQLLVTFVVEPS